MGLHCTRRLGGPGLPGLAPLTAACLGPGLRRLMFVVSHLPPDHQLAHAHARSLGAHQQVWHPRLRRRKLLHDLQLAAAPTRALGAAV